MERRENAEFQTSRTLLMRLQDLEDRIEAEHERELLDRAHRLVQERVKPRTWNAYRLTAIEQLTGPQAASELDMPVAEVYVCESRVVSMLKQEI